MSFVYSYNYPQAARDAGFKLRQYVDGIVDWRLIGTLEIERILREQNLDQIDGVLGHLSEVPLGTLLETNILDSGIAKFFILSQFAVQYLLFCRSFLEDASNDLRESLGASHMQIAQLKRSLSESNDEIIQLHKKISQMEAIHEVIYPCQFCTKNFISNDALNLHITRKHDNKKERWREALATDRSSATSISKRELTDLNLINTIKLELEIKHLKERLNNAEREMKQLPTSHHSKKSSAKKSEHSGALPSPTSSTDMSASVVSQNIKPSCKSVGIQNNLMEIKEQNDRKDVDNEDVKRGDCDDMFTHRQSEQAVLEEVLHNKLQTFEIWKDQQQKELQEFLNEINHKLNLISTALESQNAQSKETTEQEHQLDKLCKSSIADLENRLTIKIDDIGQRNIDEIQLAVNQIQLNCQDKLDELKDELMRIISKQKLKITTEPGKQQIHQTTKDIRATPLTTDEEAKSLNSLDDYNDNTYDIEIPNVIPTVQHLPDTHRTLSECSKTSSYSDLQTTAKEVCKHPNASRNEKPKPNSAVEDEQIQDEAKTSKSLIMATKLNEMRQSNNNDQTDVSDDLQSDDNSDEYAHPKTRSHHNAVDDDDDDDDDDDNNQYEATFIDQRNDKTFTVQNTKYPKLLEPKLVARREVKKLFNQRLKSFDLDVKTKSISNGAMQRALQDIYQHRNHLKKEYKNFASTRNHIKKFINKLCSKKMSASAEALMEKTEPKQSFYRNESITDEDNKNNELETTNDDDDNDDDNDVRTSTPLNSTEGDQFKQKLDKILSSPINKPNGYKNTQYFHRSQQFEYEAMVHKEPLAAEITPVPLPRKKVMFSEQNLKTTKSANPLYRDSPKIVPRKRQQLSSSLDNLA